MPGKTETRIDLTDQSKDYLFVGIDLGTSQSAIATSSGKLINVECVVGFPKDLVSFKLLGKSIVFGSECLNHRMSLDLYYPLEKGVIFLKKNQKDSARQKEAITGYMNHLISLTGKTQNQKIFVIVGAPARCTVEDRQAVVKALGGLVDAVLVVSEPFLVSYGMGLFGFGIIIDIGAGTLDICRMHGAIPEEQDQKTITKAGNHIDKMLYDMLKSRIPNAQISQFQLRKIKEKHASVGRKTDKLFVEFLISGKQVKYDISKELQKSCESILPDIIKTSRNLISNFDLEYQQNLRENIILAGCGSRIKGLKETIENELSDLGKVEIRLVDDPVFAGAIGGLRLAQDMPVDDWNRI